MKYSLPVLYFFFSVSIVFSQATNGGYSTSFLQREVSSRVAGLGGAYTAISNDPNGLFYNPGALQVQDDFYHISSTFAFLEFGRLHTTLAATKKISEDFSVGFSVNNLSGTEFTSRTPVGDPLGVLSENQIAIATTLGYQVGDVGLGITTKYINRNLSGSFLSGNGFAIDLGTKVQLIDDYSIGFSLLNIGGKMSWNEFDDIELIPYTVRAGVAKKFSLGEEDIYSEVNSKFSIPERYVLTTLDFSLSQFDTIPRVMLGAEIVPISLVTIRCGMTILGNDNGSFGVLPLTTLGGGISIRPPISNEIPVNFEIEYSIAKDHISRGRMGHFFSVNLLF
jgi:hypothetical protein